MPKFDVCLNYPFKRNETDSGISVDYRNENLRSFDNKDEALRFARSQRNRMKKQDTLYIVRKSNGSEKSIYYITSTNEDYI